MKHLLVAFSVLLFSFSAHAILEDGAEALMDYHALAVYDVLSIDPKVEFVPASSKNVPYYQGYITVFIQVEGNTCAGLENTLGTMYALVDGEVVTRVVVGAPVRDGIAGCLHFSSPRKMSFKVKVGMIPDFESKGVNKVLARIQYANQFDGQSGTAQVVLEAQGSQIKVSLKK